MNNISLATYNITYLGELSKRDIFINKVHPLIKLIVTVVYITTVISFHKYNFSGLLPLLIYPYIMINLSNIAYLYILKKLAYILPFIMLIGIFNPVFDREIVGEIFNIKITTGMISFISIILKGSFAITASFLLIATTSIEDICYGLSCIYIPNIFITQILLTYRYIFVLLKEASSIYSAYTLRAPKEKEIKIQIWGSMLGQLLLRSYDRANNLYNAMILRGFKEDFKTGSRRRINKKDIYYGISWILVIMIIKIVNIPILIENIIRI